MIVTSNIPERFQEAFSRAQQRLFREVMVKGAWVVIALSLFAHSSILIRGHSLINIDEVWSYGLRLPPLAISLVALGMHYGRAPGRQWPVLMLRLISLSALWSVLGLLVFAYEQGGTAFRVLSELSILSVFCAALVSLRGLRGCIVPLFIPVAGFIGLMLYRGHHPLELLTSLLGLIAAVGIAGFMCHVQYRIRVRDFVARQELNEVSTVDPLTGLMNRKAITERLNSERARYNRYSQSFAVILLDLDLFKQVNEQIGQQGGDSIIREVAARLRAHTRQQDGVARWGGGEFLVLLPDTSEKGATAAAENLKRALHDTPFTVGKLAPLKQTGSLGIAIYDGRETSDRLVARARQAQHMAKECGRNRVVVA